MNDYTWQEKLILEILQESGKEMSCADIMACSGGKLSVFSSQKWFGNLIVSCDIERSLKPKKYKKDGSLRNYYRITDQGISALVNIALEKQQ